MTVGDNVKLSVDKERREAITRNHTAAHLLQAALREELGTHVEQAGQLVNEKIVRFDFTHFEAMTASQLLNVEHRVNEIILQGLKVTTEELPIEEAKKRGAMALFGEKYGDVVRVVSAGDYSVELCGGTHADNTAKLGLFKIRQEGSVAAGVRRIEACTGFNVLDYLNNAIRMIFSTASVLKLNDPKKLTQAATKFFDEIKDKDRQIAELNRKLAQAQLGALTDNAVDVKGVSVVSAKAEVESGQLRDVTAMCTDKNENSVVVLASISGGKATFACRVGKEALKLGLNAGKIVRAVAQLTGGNGGGRPDMAMAGAKDITKVDDALAAVNDIVGEMM